MDDEEIQENGLTWQPHKHLRIQGPKVTFNEAGTKIAMGTNPICLNGDFFELDIKTRDVFHESFCVGICDRFLSTGCSSTLLGSTPRSWSFRFDGKKIHNKVEKEYAPPFSKIDDQFVFKIGVSFCGVTNTLSFIDNGEERGEAFVLTKKDLSKPLYPAISFASSSHSATFIGLDCDLKPAK